LEQAKESQERDKGRQERDERERRLRKEQGERELQLRRRGEGAATGERASRNSAAFPERATSTGREGSTMGNASERHIMRISISDISPPAAGWDIKF
jgi:hypothetical protein